MVGPAARSEQKVGVLSRFMNQDITYWHNLGTRNVSAASYKGSALSGYGSEYVGLEGVHRPGHQFGEVEIDGETFDRPVVIKGRWEIKREIRTDGDQRTFMSRAKVYTDVDVFEQDYLALGDFLLRDDMGELLPDDEQPGPLMLQDAWQVRMTTRITDLRNLRVERCAVL